jgi:hypothetical protein
VRKFAQHFIAPLAKTFGWVSFCEIGASDGRTSDYLLRSLPNVSYKIIDPCLDVDLCVKYARDKRVVVHRGTSLEVLPRIQTAFDCILVDGDHNWYTVYNELSLIRRQNLLRRGGMMFFHDVGWPYGRRDLYYQPELIPASARWPYQKKGIIKGRSELSDVDGLNAYYHNACHEGGSRNGVLTAIEDFIEDDGAPDYNFCRVNIQYGLGILQYRSRRVFEDIRFAALRAKACTYEIVDPIRKAFLTAPSITVWS